MLNTSEILKQELGTQKMNMAMRIFYVISLYMVNIIFSEIHVFILKVFEIPYQEIP